MNYLHYEFSAGPDDVIEVVLDRAANVQLLDTGNYQSYRTGRAFRYHGSYVTHSPYHISPPCHGLWHLVIDLGGASGPLRVSAKLLATSWR
jgi:hypothetical protein